VGLDLILNGGEDHLFVGTISEKNYERLKKEKVSESVFVIGQVMEKTSDQINSSGVKLDEKVLKSLGFKHF
jgi:thiamine monophosphate kinase